MIPDADFIIYSNPKVYWSNLLIIDLKTNNVSIYMELIKRVGKNS